MQISSVVPIKNGERYLISSFHHTIKNLEDSDELIYIDDHSDDNSWSVLKKLYSKHKNIRILRNNGAGLVDALNTGIKSSKYDWIARMDIDDLYALNRLETQRKYIVANVVGIFCDYVFIDQFGNELGQVLSPIFEQAIYWLLIQSQRTPHPGAMFSKTAFCRAGCYQSADFPAEDLGLWWRLSKLGKIVSTPNTLLKYRIHPNSITATVPREVNIKRREVISRYFYIQEFSRENNFKNTYKKYYLMQNSHERQILAFRDYFAYLSFAGLRGKVFLHLLICGPKILLNPYKIFVIIRLIRERTIRNKYRSSYKLI